MTTVTSALTDLDVGTLFDALPDGAAILDEKAHIITTNQFLSELTGWGPEEMAGQSVRMLVPERWHGLLGEAAKAREDTKTSRLVWSDMGLTITCRDGSEVPVDFAMAPISLPDRHWTLATVRSSADRVCAETARRRAEQDFRVVFEDNAAPMLIGDCQGRALAVNAAFCNLVGWSSDELLGGDSSLFTFEEDRGITEVALERIVSGVSKVEKYVKRYRHRDGRILNVEVNQAPIFGEDGQVRCVVVSERDVTEEMALREALQYQACHDPLTGLANRALLDERLERVQMRLTRSGGLAAALMFDFDDFKAVNDAHDHLTGDALLVAVATRLNEMVRETDTLCRWGGDEFFWLAEDVSEDEVAQMAERLMATMGEPFEADGVVVIQRVSVGVAIWDAGCKSQDVLREADHAMYEAKARGKGTVVVRRLSGAPTGN